MTDHSPDLTGVPQRLNLTRLGWDESRESQFQSIEDAGLEPGRIVRVDRGQNLVRIERGEVRCTVASAETLAVVGDWVALEPALSGNLHRIAHVLPRSTTLQRAGDDELGAQAIASNVDYVFVVHPCDRLNLRRLERELAQVAASGASPVVVLSKSDLASDVESLITTTKSVAPNAQVMLTSASEGVGMDEFERCLAGNKTGALIGPSGAGKSTLVNALIGSDVQATSEVRSDDRRGRHTTTARQLLALPAGGALVDTPGMREFGLTGDELNVEAVFGDISTTAVNCRFRDCRHSGEPGCAVSAAIEAGDIAEDRLASYRKLEREREAWRAKNDPVVRKRREARWKSVTRRMRQRRKLEGQ